MNYPVTPRRLSRALFLLGPLALLLAAAPLTRATPPARVTVAGDAPAAVSQSRSLGALAPARTVSLALTLPLRDPGGLEDFLRRLADPADPAYGRYLTTVQFAARFGPTQADYDAVAAYAHAQGLTITGAHPDRLFLDVAGSAAAVEAAFGARLTAYQAPDGRLFYAPQAAPRVPRALAGRLAGVVGLSNFAVRRPAAQERLSAMPQDVGTGPSGGLSPADIRNAYNLSQSPLNGAGQTLAVFELDGYTQSDIQAYENHFGLPNVTLQNVLVNGFSGKPGDGGSPDGQGASEVTLDIEMQLALAPGASAVQVYETTNDNKGILDGYGRIANDNTAKEISTSWGLDEQDNDNAFLQSEHAIFAQMAAQGQTIFAAAGDHGAYDSGKTSDGLRVDDPASQPYVCAVGGTSLTNTRAGGSYVSETTWNSGVDGTGGGGISSLWPIPSWQQGVIGHNTEASPSMRNVPDVSLDADPNTGYAIYYQGQWIVYGGVSCATPLWAAFSALVNQQRVAQGQPVLGQINLQLYAIAQGSRYGSDFHDIADNSDNLFYHALPGYDLATGLGSFNGASLLADLAPGATTPSPPVASFPAGLNFLSLPADYSGVPVSTVFGDNSAALYAWSPTLLQYLLAPASPADAVHLGQGYWVRFSTAVTVTAPGNPAPTNAPFTLSLSNGWNMIGDPFNAGIPVGNLSVSNGGQTSSFADAVSAGLISGTLYRYDLGSRAYAPLGSGDSLAPTQGYWVRAFRAVTLQVPP